MSENTQSQIVELDRKDFPPELLEIPEVPEKLYIRGKMPPADFKRLSIVGSRSASPYGKTVTKALVEGLAGAPVSILSGLALGIDGIAHEEAIKAGLHTMAIPGSGINESAIYPRAHARLAQRIVESGGCLLSEYEPDFRATVWSFPRRNRIMAGLSHAVLIIEAQEKSGTLITGRLATDYNRDVLTVPGSIFDSRSYGPHMLLRLGATLIRNSNDILEALHIKQKEEVRDTTTLTTSEKNILNLAEVCESKDDIIRTSGLSSGEALAILLSLELKGFIEEKLGRIFTKNNS